MRPSSCRRALTPAMFCLAAFLLGDAAGAEDFPLRSELANARTHGLGRPDLPLLKRGAGPGRKAVLDSIRKKFGAARGSISTAGEPKVEVGKQRTMTTWADGRALVVFGDGSKVSFRNHRVLQNSKPVALAERLSPDRLADLGRQFIERNLAEFIQLGPKEKLEPFSTRVEIGAGADLNATTPAVEQVLGNAIVFTRTVDGVAVLGSGSKVVLLLTTDGQVGGFDFDWAPYQATGRRVKVLGAAEIQDRVHKLASVQLDASNVKVKRYECGLFDAGLRHRDPQAPIQGACLIHGTETRIVDAAAHAKDPASGHVIVAIVDAIPIGETVETDKLWPHAQKLLGLPQPSAVGRPGVEFKARGKTRTSP